MHELIKFENVWFTYAGADSPALRGVSFSVRSGEFILLSGPSGCGKSTLLRCMNGLIPHFHEGDLSGTVRVAGVDTRTTNVYQLAQVVGLVFPDPESQLVALEVQDDVAFGPGNLGLPKDEVLQRVEWALNSTGTAKLRHAQVFKLSGGEQQKVAIASILALKPQILVLDEPTANLDLQSAKALIELLGELNKNGTTIVLAEHRLSMAARFCNRVILMDEGQIILDAPPEEALTSSKIEQIGVERPEFYSLKKSLLEFGLEANNLRSMEELFLAVRRKEIKCAKP
jgi:energy-coupling factor transporter ATP-binding protein EcfA2